MNQNIGGSIHGRLGLVDENQKRLLGGQSTSPPQSQPPQSSQRFNYSNTRIKLGNTSMLGSNNERSTGMHFSTNGSLSNPTIAGPPISSSAGTMSGNVSRELGTPLTAPSTQPLVSIPRGNINYLGAAVPTQTIGNGGLGGVASIASSSNYAALKPLANPAALPGSSDEFGGNSNADAVDRRWKAPTSSTAPPAPPTAAQPSVQYRYGASNVSDRPPQSYQPPQPYSQLEPSAKLSSSGSSMPYPPYPATAPAPPAHGTASSVASYRDWQQPSHHTAPAAPATYYSAAPPPLPPHSMMTAQNPAEGGMGAIGRRCPPLDPGAPSSSRSGGGIGGGMSRGGIGGGSSTYSSSSAAVTSSSIKRSRSRIDPAQMPRPEHPQRDVLYHTRAAPGSAGSGRRNPPSCRAHFRAVDTGNCSPRLMRATMVAPPCSAQVLREVALPMALLCTPFAQPQHGEEAVPVVDFQQLHQQRTGGSARRQGLAGIQAGASGGDDLGDSALPPRCNRCGGYVNPDVQWTEGGNKWVCNLCTMTNPVPPW